MFACMYALSANSNLDLRVWLEIRYWALFFLDFSFPCLFSLISRPYAMFAFSARTWLKDLLSRVLHKHIFCFSVCCWCSLSNHVPPQCTSPSLFLPILLPICSLSKESHSLLNILPKLTVEWIWQYKQIYIKQTLECANIRSAEPWKIRIRSEWRCITHIGISRSYLEGFTSVPPKNPRLCDLSLYCNAITKYIDGD